MDIHAALDQIEGELDALPVEPWSAQAASWKLRAVDVVGRVVGEEDTIARELRGINFSPYRRPLGTQYTPSGWADIFDSSRERARGVLDATRYRLKLDSAGITVSGGDDPLGHHLHPLIREACTERLASGQYSDAIRAALRAVEVRVRDLSGIDVRSVRDLMSQALSETTPVLRLNDLATTSDKSEQEGFRFIFMGAMQGIRNPKAHDEVEQRDPDRTLDYLGLASLMMHRLDDAEERL